MDDVRPDAGEQETAAEQTDAEQADAGHSDAERAVAEQAAADLAAVKQWAAERAAAERTAAEATERAAAAKEAADEAELEQARAEQAAADLAAVRAWAAQQAAQQREAAEQADAERRAAGERADVQRAQAEWAAERQAPERAPLAVPAPRAQPRGATAEVGRTESAGKRGGRRSAIALVAAVLAVVLVAAGVGLTLRLAGDDGTPTAAEDAEQVPDAVLPELTDPAPVLAALSADAPVPTPAGVSAALAPLLAAPVFGSGLSAQVVDVATGQVLLDRDADDPGTPASTAKLLTSLAVLTALDPTDTLTTTVVAGSTPGEVVLVGAGDPTLSTVDPSTDYPGAATVADLAAQVQQALGGQPVTSVVVDNSRFTGPLTANGWGPGDAPSTYAAPVTAAAVDGARVTPGRDPRSGSPGTDAGRALAQALGAGNATVALGTAPVGARTLGTVESAPIARLVEEALTASDNLLAESLARQVAIARGLPASFTGAADAVTAALTDAGLDTSGLTLFDGSGLSQGDRVPASLLVDVVRAAADGSIPDADGLLSGLPVAGYDGTLAERAVDQGAGTPGSVRAKTGTLLGVNDLAGTVLTADGRLLAFAVLADGATGSVESTEAALDVVADALAGCGCR